jgi:hypothetical protein
MGTAEYYRQKAEKCREQAKGAKFPDDKAAWLKLAEDWLQLAVEASRRTAT